MFNFIINLPKQKPELICSDFYVHMRGLLDEIRTYFKENPALD